MTDIIELINRFIQIYRDGITNPLKLFKAFFIEIGVGLAFILIAYIIPSPRGKAIGLAAIIGIILLVHAIYCLIIFGSYALFVSICKRSSDRTLLACDESIEYTNAFWVSTSITLILGIVLCVISGDKTPKDGMYWEPIFISGIGLVLFSIISIIKRLRNQRKGR